MPSQRIPEGQALRSSGTSGWLGLLAGLVLWAGCAPSPGLVRWAEGASPSAVFSVETDEPTIALTLDDGPSPEHTPAVLDVLARYGAKATFFLVGERAEAHPGLVARIVAEGHEIGNHGWRLTPPVVLGAAQTARDIARTDSVLARWGPLRWYRPGVGAYTAAIRDAAHRQGYRIALGSLYPNDPYAIWAPLQTSYVLRYVRPGDVLILHDGIGARTRAPGVLERLLPALHDRGYRVTTLSDLVDRAGG